MNTNFRGFSIEPKRDFGSNGFLIDSKVVKEGFVVCKDGCNVMPGGTWFQTIPEAKRAIDVFIRTKGDADRFWEIMQPFGYKLGQRVPDYKECTVIKGRFKAVIRDHVVVQLDTISRDGKTKTVKTFVKGHNHEQT